MGSKAVASAALLLSLNLLFMTVPPSTAQPNNCPIDVLQLRACSDLLGGVNVTVGPPATQPCCNRINGLGDLEAAACVCTAIKANVLGNNLDVPISLSTVLNSCGSQLPPDFQCA